MVCVDEHTGRLDVAMALPLLPADRCAHVLKLRRIEDRRNSISAYLLLARALRLEHGWDDSPRLVRRHDGKPLLQGLDGIHLSLSHSGPVAACATATHPVGVDVECVAPLEEDVVQHTMSEPEQRLIASSTRPEVEFARLWTMKESLFKMRRTGLTDDLPQVLAYAANCQFTSTVRPGYVLTGCEDTTNENENKQQIIYDVMTTTINEIDGRLVAKLVGQLDTLAAVEAEKAMEPAFQVENQDVLLDCTELEYIASAGLRLFLTLLKAVKSRGGKVIIKGINDDIANVFKVTGFSSLFEFE